MLAVFFIVLLFAVARFIRNKWAVPARGYVQLGVLVISEIALFCNRGLSCQNCPLSFGLCPIGTTQRLAFFRHLSLLYVLSVIAVVGGVLGSLSCGWVCPVGFVQDLLHASSLRKSQLRIPEKTKVLRYAALVLLVLLILLEARTGTFSKRGIDVLHPVVIYGGAALLAIAYFTRRPFCKLFCPLGLIFGKLNKISLLKVDLGRCVRCGACQGACAMGIDPSEDANRDLCIKCYHCVAICKRTGQGPGIPKAIPEL